MTKYKWGEWELTAHLRFEDGALMQLWRRRGNEIVSTVEMADGELIETLRHKQEQQVQWRPVAGQTGVTNQSKVFGEKGD